jgi:Cellulase (glycosyl hydrolase family 5)
VVSVSGATLQLDGHPAFLFGVSLFDALGSTPPRDQDLDALRTWGVNTMRVWAHWHEPIYQADGTLTAQGRSRVLQLVQRLQSRGLVLELVLLRPGQLPGQPFALFASEAARLRSVSEITSALRDHRNVLFDLYNEHDHPDGPISHAAARALRDAVKAIDPARVVTISSTEYHLMTADGRVGENEARNLREEAGQDAGCVAVDVVAAHFPRTGDWAAATGSRVSALRAALDRIGRGFPIYLNEERRANPGSAIAADAYQRAHAAAQQASAAGWVFHTAAGFELKKRPFIDALTPAERAGLTRLRKP